MARTLSRPIGGGGPQCPFCGAPWTEAMLDHHGAMSDPHGCACCGPSGLHAGMAERGRAHGHSHAPVADLCCANCGHAIYRAPRAVGD